MDGTDETYGMAGMHGLDEMDRMYGINVNGRMYRVDMGWICDRWDARSGWFG